MPEPVISVPGELAAAISNAVVRINAAHNGRGPARARTFLLEDTIVTVMEEVAAPIERTLADVGEQTLARNVRSRVQDAMSEELKAAVSELTGRRVVAVMSAAHLDPDIACAVFVLEPLAVPGGA